MWLKSKIYKDDDEKGEVDEDDEDEGEDHIWINPFVHGHNQSWFT